MNSEENQKFVFTPRPPREMPEGERPIIMRFLDLYRKEGKKDEDAVTLITALESATKEEAIHLLLNELEQRIL